MKIKGPADPADPTALTYTFTYRLLLLHTVLHAIHDDRDPLKSGNIFSNLSFEGFCVSLQIRFNVKCHRISFDIDPDAREITIDSLVGSASFPRLIYSSMISVSVISLLHSGFNAHSLPLH